LNRSTSRYRLGRQQCACAKMQLFWVKFAAILGNRALPHSFISIRELMSEEFGEALWEMNKNAVMDILRLGEEEDEEEEEEEEERDVVRVPPVPRRPRLQTAPVVMRPRVGTVPSYSNVPMAPPSPSASKFEMCPMPSSASPEAKRKEKTEGRRERPKSLALYRNFKSRRSIKQQARWKDKSVSDDQLTGPELRARYEHPSLNEVDVIMTILDDSGMLAFGDINLRKNIKKKKKKKKNKKSKQVPCAPPLVQLTAEKKHKRTQSSPGRTNKRWSRLFFGRRG